jgi:hypothetical protein
MRLYQAFYALTIITALCVRRASRSRFPLFYFWMLLSLPAILPLPLHLQWALILAVGMLRAVSSVEAYVAVTLARPVWSAGPQLLLFSWLAAAALTFCARSFAEHAGIDWAGLLELRRYLVIWNGIWLLIACLFLALWRGMGDRRDHMHCAIVAGLSWFAAAGALVKLAGISDAAYWSWDAALYLGQAGLLIIWVAGGAQ